VVLKISASGKTGETQLFLTELTYGGLFTLQGIPADSLHPVLLIECPRILFPFARAIVADVTRDGGFPPLLIQPVDFAAMYRQSATQPPASVAPAAPPATH
jgi:preprotein translocase subunit SecB